MKTTKKMRVSFIFFLGLGCGFAQYLDLFSQISEPMPAIPTTWGHSWGVGARDMGMGGAYSAVGGDFSALYYNPAGLGTVEQSEFSGTFSELLMTNKADFLGIENTENSNYTHLNAIGLSYPIPTARGSMVFGFGYHRVRQFDNALFATQFISKPGDSVTWSNRHVEKGWMSNTSVGGALEIGPGIFIGGSIQFWGGENDFTWTFQEADNPFNLFTFSRFDSTDHVFTSFSGVNMTLGALFKSPHVSVGGSVSTPFTLKSRESWDYKDVTTWDLDIQTETDVVSDQGNFEYKIRIPLSLRAGVALNQGIILVSGEVELVNYNQIEYKTEPSTEFLDRNMANLAIQRNLRNVLNYRFGGELAIPNTPARIRAGYAIIKTPFKNVLYQKDRKVLSFGAGFLFAEHLVLDVGFASTGWEGAPDDMINKEKLNASQVLVSVSYKM